MTTQRWAHHEWFRQSTLAVLVALACQAHSNQAAAQTYAPWLRQIGITNAVESAANWGNGQVLGVVDTGVNATHPQFAAGQVSQTLSSCAAVSFKCPNGFADDNSHGTAVASIAAGYRTLQYPSVTAGGYTTVAGNFIGVAPSANIIAEKVLNAAGSGYSTDVANGIKKAADAGAGVINVSITYSNDYNTVLAINYAASKGAFIVWAGGNSAQNLVNNLNTSGLTQTAIQHLIFAGSVNSLNTASSFTNKPGSGALVSTTGTKTAYSTRWIMAPGESIIAPRTTAGTATYSLWSGTSMAAPVISGSLMLLQNAWPILKTKGTTADLLLATTKDLGTAGTDATYGRGLANLTTAFNPYGTLTVTTTSGQSVAVNSLSGSLLSSGALGSLSSIQSKLANYTAFDGYARNFTVNLSGLIKTSTSKATLNPLPTNTFSAPKVMRYAGGELAYALDWDGGAAQHIGEFGYNAEKAQPMMTGYTLFTSATGSVSGMGYGASSSYPFAKALYNDDLIARQMSDFDTTSMNSLAQGGYQFSYGSNVSRQWRLAASYTATPGATAMAPDAQQNSQVKIGVANRYNDRISSGVTYSNVAESNSLLGAAYSSGSILALGRNATDVFGFSLGYKLDHNSGLLFNGELAYTKAGSADAGSLFSGTSAMRSQSWGVTYLQQNVWKTNDQFAASLKQPLRLNSGSAAITMASVDQDGYAVYEKSWTSLVPDGREIDVTLSYRMPTSKTDTLMLQAAYQKDALNMAGNNQAQLGLTWNTRF